MKILQSFHTLLQTLSYKTAALYATCTCYYMFLSVLPASMFAVTLLPYLTSIPGVTLPETFLNPLLDLQQSLSVVSRPSLFSISALIWIWSSSKGFHAISEGLDAVLETDQKSSFLRRRLSSVFNFLLVSFCLITTITIQIFGRQLLEFFLHLVPALSIHLSFFKLRFLSSLAILTICFAILYRLHPGTHIPFRNCLLGGIFTAVGWIGFSAAYSIYINYFSSQYRLFGKIGSLFLTAVWLRFCILVLFLGFKLAHAKSHCSGSISDMFLKLFGKHS